MSQVQMKPVRESPLEAIVRCLSEVCRSPGLRRARVVGKSIRAHCRRHDDRNPSLYIYERAGSDGVYRWFYKCHSCGGKGTLVDLIAQETGLSRYEAARVLSRYLGEEISSTPTDGVRRETRDDAAVYDLMAEYCHLIAWVDSPFYEKQMQVQRDYLRDRTSLRQIRQLGIGIAPNAVVRKSTLESFLSRKGHTDLLEDMIRLLERVACRVVIPIRDDSGHVVSICTRCVGGSEQNRYRNDGTNGNALLGIHVAHDAIHQAGYAIVVEGPFDMLTLRDLGSRCLTKVLDEGNDAPGPLDNVVACMSSRPTLAQMRILKKHTDTFIMVRDGDKADDAEGAQAIMRDASRLGLLAAVVAVPDGMDPDEYIRKLLSEGMPPADVLELFTGEVLKSNDLISIENEPSILPDKPLAIEDEQPVSPYEAYSEADGRPHAKVGREELRQVLAMCEPGEVLVWLTLKIQASMQRATNGRVQVVGDSIARDCRLSWRHTRTLMEGLRDKGVIAYSTLRENAKSEVTLAVSTTTNASHIRVPYDFVWAGHAEALGCALPTLLTLKAAAIGKEPVTNILVKTIASRNHRSERAIKADLRLLGERRHVRECRLGGRRGRLVSLMPVGSEVFGKHRE